MNKIDKLEKILANVKGSLVPWSRMISKSPTLRKFKSYTKGPLFFKRAEDEISWIGAKKTMVEITRPDRCELETMNDEDIKKITKELRSIYIYTKFVQPLEREVAWRFQS